MTNPTRRALQAQEANSFEGLGKKWVLKSNLSVNRLGEVLLRHTPPLLTVCSLAENRKPEPMLPASWDITGALGMSHPCWKPSNSSGKGGFVSHTELIPVSHLLAQRHSTSYPTNTHTTYNWKILPQRKPEMDGLTIKPYKVRRKQHQARTNYFRKQRRDMTQVT